MQTILEIDMLRCFMAVAQYESFTKAGDKIGLTQSGVSVKIRKLEERIGVPVFFRTSKTLSLTPDGELLKGYARRILEMHDDAVRRLSAPKASGNLRLGIVDYFVPDMLPVLLGHFSQQYPDIHLEVQTGVGMNLIPLYEQGKLDLVVAGKDAHPSIGRILMRDPLIWTIGLEYEIPENKPLPLVMLSAPCHFRKMAIEALEKDGSDWKIVFTGTSMASVQAAVQAGLGVTVFPSRALTSKLRQLPLNLGFPELPMHEIALFTDEKQDMPAKKVFIDYLELELSKRIF